MKVHELMETKVVTVTPDTTYENAAKILYMNSLSGLPVISDNSVIGIISEKDLLKSIFPEYKDFAETPHAYLNSEIQENVIKDIRHQPIKNFMTVNVHHVTADRPVLHAGAIMLARDINRLPVIENNTLVGIISRSRIYRNLLKHHLGF